jgi:hypothetical protein
MARVNCWEYTGCGRESGGCATHDLGVCPAATDSRLHGVNNGDNAGRACWAVAGTLCDGEIHGTHASKIDTCMQCAFYHEVLHEEGEDAHSTTEILLHLARMGDLSSLQTPGASLQMPGEPSGDPATA